MIFSYFKILSIEILVCLLLLLHIDKPKNINLIKIDIYNVFVKGNTRYLAEYNSENKEDQTLQQKSHLGIVQNIVTKKEQKKKKKKLPKSQRTTAKERALEINAYVDYLKETCNGSEKLMSLKYISYLIRYMDITYEEKKTLQDLVEQYIYSNIEHEKYELSKLIDVYINKEEDEYSRINFQNILYDKERVESLKHSEYWFLFYKIFHFYNYLKKKKK
ncbi:putative exported protein [Plasmodium gaboni]|uniref:Putative exported protein n=1 Tax=Plasmodium gaboni TaxID=647221 RepID=A0A151LJJ6_9APIC|nr:putative exported protein [Plasmodium gaboni]KYN99114.1 putative exported protein [Plasmodium gaboni]